MASSSVRDELCCHTHVQHNLVHSAFKNININVCTVLYAEQHFIDTNGYREGGLKHTQFNIGPCLRM